MSATAVLNDASRVESGAPEALNAVRTSMTVVRWPQAV
jgi:hypothetical protein